MEHFTNINDKLFNGNTRVFEHLLYDDRVVSTTNGNNTSNVFKALLDFVDIVSVSVKDETPDLQTFNNEIKNLFEYELSNIEYFQNICNLEGYGKLISDIEPYIYEIMLTSIQTAQQSFIQDPDNDKFDTDFIDNLYLDDHSKLIKLLFYVIDFSTISNIEIFFNILKNNKYENDYTMMNNIHNFIKNFNEENYLNKYKEKIKDRGIIQTGWLETSGGHAILIYYEKIRSRYKIVIFNSGAGINDNHAKLDDKYAVISENTITNKQMYCLFIMLRIISNTKIKNKDNPQLIFYTIIKQYFNIDHHDKIIPSNNSDNDFLYFHLPQISGSCTFYSTYHFIRYLFCKHLNFNSFNYNKYWASYDNIMRQWAVYEMARNIYDLLVSSSSINVYIQLIYEALNCKSIIKDNEHYQLNIDNYEDNIINFYNDIKERYIEDINNYNFNNIDLNGKIEKNKLDVYQSKKIETQYKSPFTDNLFDDIETLFENIKIFIKTLVPQNITDFNKNIIKWYIIEMMYRIYNRSYIYNDTDNDNNKAKLINIMDIINRGGQIDIKQFLITIDDFQNMKFCILLMNLLLNKMLNVFENNTEENKEEEYSDDINNKIKIIKSIFCRTDIILPLGDSQSNFIIKDKDIKQIIERNLLFIENTIFKTETSVNLKIILCPSKDIIIPDILKDNEDNEDSYIQFIYNISNYIVSIANKDSFHHTLNYDSATKTFTVFSSFQFYTHRIPTNNIYELITIENFNNNKQFINIDENLFDNTSYIYNIIESINNNDTNILYENLNDDLFSILYNTYSEIQKNELFLPNKYILENYKLIEKYYKVDKNSDLEIIYKPSSQEHYTQHYLILNHYIKEYINEELVEKIIKINTTNQNGIYNILLLSFYILRYKLNLLTEEFKNYLKNLISSLQQTDDNDNKQIFLNCIDDFFLISINEQIDNLSEHILKDYIEKINNSKNKKKNKKKNKNINKNNILLNNFYFPLLLSNLRDINSNNFLIIKDTTEIIQTNYSISKYLSNAGVKNYKGYITDEYEISVTLQNDSVEEYLNIYKIIESLKYTSNSFSSYKKTYFSNFYYKKEENNYKGLDKNFNEIFCKYEIEKSTNFLFYKIINDIEYYYSIKIRYIQETTQNTILKILSMHDIYSLGIRGHEQILY